MYFFFASFFLSLSINYPLFSPSFPYPCNVFHSCCQLCRALPPVCFHIVNWNVILPFREPFHFPTKHDFIIREIVALWLNVWLEMSVGLSECIIGTFCYVFCMHVCVWVCFFSCMCVGVHAHIHLHLSLLCPLPLCQIISNPSATVRDPLQSTNSIPISEYVQTP